MKLAVASTRGRDQDAADRSGTALIAGRYRVEGTLGRGAMGEVLRVCDVASGQRLALKRLIRPASDRLAATLFEREYHTLLSLRHPRIIQAFDYGVAEQRPYYTMELLDGGDLRELAPLPYPHACRLLGDVASSLALLHARRLLHRDLNARNVRTSADGHCKLIDFGALASFGSHREIIGAPPCIAPEALHGLPLDQRADLYALGTLAYYLLTGRNAYPARSIEELEQALRSVPRLPSEVLAERSGDRPFEPIPERLDALVMSLVSLDPLTRPRSAAEVIERLSQITPLDAAMPEVARGYLSGGRLIGREHALREIAGSVASAREGRGDSVLVVGASGAGKTRLLAELALHSQLAGAVVARADGAAHGGPYGVVRELLARLIDALPEAALEVAPDQAELLARLDLRLGTRAANENALSPADMPGELRKRTQLALRKWLVALSARHRVTLIVDDLHCADEASVAVLARLVHEAPDHGLLIGAAVDAGASAGVTATLRTIEDAARVLHPQALDQAQTRELLGTLFGEVPNLPRLAQFVFERSRGLPQRIHELGEALVAARVLRNIDGIWLIPEQLEECAGALHDEASLARARLAPLSAHARAAAELLSLRRAAMSIDIWLELARADGQSDPFTALDELVGAGVVESGPSGVRFAQEWLRVQAEAAIAPSRRTQLHRTLGRLLLAQPGADQNTRLLGGFHLLQGGDETRGADLLAELGLSLVYEADEMWAAAPALEAALAIYEKQGRSRRELCRLLGALSVAGYRCDLRLSMQYGERAVALQEELLALRVARKLRRFVGPRLALYAALLTSAFGLVRELGPRGLLELPHAIRMFFASCNSLCGAAVICLDVERARRYATALEPLAPFGMNHAGGLVHRCSEALALLAEDRHAQAAAMLREVIEVLETREVTALPPAAHGVVLGGALYALGAIEAFRCDDRALGIADRLAAIGLRLYDMAADQVRATYHANRGEAELAAEYRRRVELHAIDAGSGWQAEVWAPCAALGEVGMIRDVIALKCTAQELEALAARVPSLERYAMLARSAYRGMRGELDQLEGAVSWVRAAPPHSFTGWVSSLAVLGYLFNRHGQHARARELCTHALSHLTPVDLEYTAHTLNLEVQLAMANAGLGDTAAAIEALEALLSRLGSSAAPITRGFVHEHLARVHRRAGTMDEARAQAEHMTKCYDATGHNGLIAFAARLRGELGSPRESGIHLQSRERASRRSDPGDAILSPTVTSSTRGSPGSKD